MGWLSDWDQIIPGVLKDTPFFQSIKGMVDTLLTLHGDGEISYRTSLEFLSHFYDAFQNQSLQTFPGEIPNPPLNHWHRLQDPRYRVYMIMRSISQDLAQDLWGDIPYTDIEPKRLSIFISFLQGKGVRSGWDYFYQLTGKASIGSSAFSVSKNNYQLTLSNVSVGEYPIYGYGTQKIVYTPLSGTKTVYIPYRNGFGFYPQVAGSQITLEPPPGKVSVFIHIQDAPSSEVENRFNSVSDLVSKLLPPDVEKLTFRNLDLKDGLRASDLFSINIT